MIAQRISLRNGIRCMADGPPCRSCPERFSIELDPGTDVAHSYSSASVSPSPIAGSKASVTSAMSFRNAGSMAASAYEP